MLIFELRPNFEHQLAFRTSLTFAFFLVQIRPKQHVHVGEDSEAIDKLLEGARVHQRWISDMGIDGPTFVPKSGYF